MELIQINKHTTDAINTLTNLMGRNKDAVETVAKLTQKYGDKHIKIQPAVEEDFKLVK